MKKTSIAIIIYIIGLLLGALVLGIWDADTNLSKAIMCIVWTSLFLIALFYPEKKDFE